TAFTVTSGGASVAVNAVAVDAAAKTVTLTLASPVVRGQAVTVAYADPTAGNDANAIQDAIGNDAASLQAVAVTNATPPSITSVLIPNAAMKIGDVVTA
ncbi:SwmB domain-containing protein, partial [Aureimonas ureilytica]|uniref:SwmB domain-containing protein n=1 Tax=Aureimonas ureilytica TaxID=401562 RepID=UPI000AF054E1